MTRQVVIWGASGHALVVADIIRLMGGFHIVGLLDDVNVTRHGSESGGIRILGGQEKLRELRNQGTTHLICGIGDCALRLRLMQKAQEMGFEPATAIHPKATVAPDVLLGLGGGTVIAAGAVVNPAAQIGRNCIINTSASVDHECVIGDGSHIGPGAHIGGVVTTGAAVWVGIGAVVRDRVRIGAGSIIGAGAVVTKDVPSGVVVYGVPGRVIRTVEEQSVRPRYPGSSGTLPKELPDKGCRNFETIAD